MESISKLDLSEGQNNVGCNNIVLIPASQQVYMSNDVPYRFHQKYVQQIISNNSNHNTSQSDKPFIIDTLVHDLQLVKSKHEQAIMRFSNEIASKAFIETMYFSRPFLKESQLDVKFDFECQMKGACKLAYPSVVASGKNASTIHYLENSAKISPSELVLMDAGCVFNQYCSDITRTWPIKGIFSPAQKDIYSAVLEVQNHCISKCNESGMNLEILFQEMAQKLASVLIDLGIIPKDCPNLFHKTLEFCPHHVGHYLGLEVHDSSTSSKMQSFKEGMVFTVEPGIYIPINRDDVSKHFRGISVRIEDDILITENGYENLTRSCPKSVDEIENILGSRTR